MLIQCIGISTIYWKHSVFCGHFLVESYGMMEYSNCERSELSSCSGSSPRMKAFMQIFEVFACDMGIYLGR